MAEASACALKRTAIIGDKFFNIKRSAEIKIKSGACAFILRLFSSTSRRLRHEQFYTQTKNAIFFFYSTK